MFKFSFCLQEICGDIDTEVQYQAFNFYTEKNRYIYFLSDVSHLMKTTRSCIANSGEEDEKDTCGVRGISF